MSEPASPTSAAAPEADDQQQQAQDEQLDQTAASEEAEADGEEEQQEEEQTEEAREEDDAANESTALDQSTAADAETTPPADEPTESQQQQPASAEEQLASPQKASEEESKEEEQPSLSDDHLTRALAKDRSGVSTGMQSEDQAEEEQDEPQQSDAGGQTGTDQMEMLEQSNGAPSQRDAPNGGGGADDADGNGHQLGVEVTIMPDGFKHLELFRGDEEISTVKSVLSERFKLDPRQMRLALGDLVLEDDRSLAEYRDFDVSRFRQQGLSEEEIAAAPLAFVLNIELGDSDPSGQPEEPRETYRMPDIIKVVINKEELELEAEEEEEKELAGEGRTTERTPEQVVYVQVIRDNLHHPKPFLGGFRHKYFGTIYHHSSTQTARKKKKQEVVKFHRETQTIQIISRSQQTAREAGTQMERRDLLQDHSNDQVIMSRPYFTADELEALRDEKAREVQCFLRQCFAWRRVRRLREGKSEKLAREIAARAAKAKKEAEEHARQIQRRMHPRTKEDFAVLFAELEAWRLHETQRIKESGLSPEEIAAALQELLHKEVKLLQTIDRLKITAARENKWNRTQTSLEKMASPKEWSSSEGDLIEVETPFTTRAKELVDLYNGLCLRNLSRAQRVDVLLHIKYTVKEFDCELSREIVELIKREEDLLRRQRSEASLEGCRKRLQNLFLAFVNTPAFNPESANFQRVRPEDVNPTPPPALSSSLAKPGWNNSVVKVAGARQPGTGQ